MPGTNVGEEFRRQLCTENPLQSYQGLSLLSFA